MQVLVVDRRSGLVFSTLDPQAAPPPLLAETLPAYGGTITTEIDGNWKTCVEHLLSADVAWHWPLLALRSEQDAIVIEQIVPRTFLRTRLLTHVFGAASDTRRLSTAAFKQACEELQKKRAAGVMASGDDARVAAFHRRLADAAGGQP